MNSIMVTIAPEGSRTRILVAQGETDLLKAILPAAELAHPRAVETLLEGLALWHRQRLCVVLVVDEGDRTSGAQCLGDNLGFGERSLHYEVVIACREGRRRRRRRGVDGIADFRDLRQMAWEFLR